METKKRGKFMGTKEKLSGLLLAVCMAFILAPITVRADVTTEKWTDFAAGRISPRLTLQAEAVPRRNHIRLPHRSSLQSWR